MKTSKWESSFAFRKFREKLSDLSKVYWMHQLGVDALNEIFLSKGENVQHSTIISNQSIIRKDSTTIKDVKSYIPDYLKRARLFLLVGSSANLEAYLKEIVFVYLIEQGYVEKDLKKNDLLCLNSVGEAIGFPILGKNSVPEPLKYAEKLLDINFGVSGEKWNTFYQLRCEAAHNAGMVNLKTIKRLPNLHLDEFDLLGITWEELKEAMDATDKIATILDKKISTYNIRLIEVEQILRSILYSKKKLPKRKELWSYLFNEFKLFPINLEDKEKIERKFYPFRKGR